MKVFRRDCPSGYMELHCGEKFWEFKKFVPDPRKKQYRKPKFWISCESHIRAPRSIEEFQRTIDFVARYSKSDPVRYIATLLFKAAVAQVEEQSPRKRQRGVSTTPCGSNLINA